MSPPNLLLVKLERKLSHVPTTIFEEKTTIMKNNTGSLRGHNVSPFTAKSAQCDNRLMMAKLIWNRLDWIPQN